eukprot:TRINITY_DN780103_c0_g1_i1.p1 TRINITY_DN780103_c0_g1~~TRINITY_DN780103_c0_g1_i1.p1  ORF type:complete len:460 (-),score=140.97 TRINITY_DN780103_c0_g1_i1:114-1493(-)
MSEHQPLYSQTEWDVKEKKVRKEISNEFMLIVNECNLTIDCLTKQQQEERIENVRLRGEISKYESVFDEFEKTAEMLNDEHLKEIQKLQEEMKFFKDVAELNQQKRLTIEQDSEAQIEEFEKQFKKAMAEKSQTESRLQGTLATYEAKQKKLEAELEKFRTESTQHKSVVDRLKTNESNIIRQAQNQLSQAQEVFEKCSSERDAIATELETCKAKSSQEDAYRQRVIELEKEIAKGKDLRDDYESLLVAHEAQGKTIQQLNQSIKKYQTMEEEMGSLKLSLFEKTKEAEVAKTTKDKNAAQVKILSSEVEELEGRYSADVGELTTILEQLMAEKEEWTRQARANNAMNRTAEPALLDIIEDTNTETEKINENGNVTNNETPQFSAMTSISTHPGTDERIYPEGTLQDVDDIVEEFVAIDMQGEEESGSVGDNSTILRKGDDNEDSELAAVPVGSDPLSS